MKITPPMALVALLMFFSAIEGRAGDDWIYAVKPGDTLTGVAAAYLQKPGDWRKLQRLNRVAEPRRLVPGSSLRIPMAWLKQESAVAEVVRVQGDVRRLTKDTTQAVSAGDKLAVGSTIITGADSNLTLRFADGSRLLVSQNSRFTLSHMMFHGKTGASQTTVNLRVGSVSTQVAQQRGPAARYEIESQALNLGVRGTDFRVGVAADGVTRSEVLEGLVKAAGSGGAVNVAGGYGTFAAPGRPPAPPTLLPAAPDLGGLPERFERVPLRFNWPGQPGVAQYRAEVFAGRSFETLLLEGVFQEPGAKWPDLPDGKYVLRVRGVGGNGLEGLNADRDFTLKARPEPPLMVMPLNGMTISGDKTRFRWTKPAGARDFRFQLSATRDFAIVLFDELYLGNSKDVPQVRNLDHVLALEPGQYYWRIARVAANGDQGPFSDAQGFTQSKAQEAPAPAAAPQEAPARVPREQAN